MRARRLWYTRYVGRSEEGRGRVRSDGRQVNELRSVRLTRNFLPKAEGSCLIELGNTRVLCTVTIEDRVPPWRRGQGGWLTAEYAMLPRATEVRTPREVTRGRPSGRSQEIQRLIGRALRSAVDLPSIGDRTLWVDCDVIEADGGTRTASVTGAAVALVDALRHLQHKDAAVGKPLVRLVSAVSAGILKDGPALDLCYAEDSQALVDANFVVTDRGEFVEVQGTGEGRPLGYDELLMLVDLSREGASRLIEAQRAALGEDLLEVLRPD